MNTRVRNYLETEEKFYKNQHGFRKNRGTETALITIYETIAINQTNRKNQCNIVCRDISKAFDKIWHLGLKFKILQQNFPPLIEKYLANYIDNRKVNIKDEDGNYGRTINLKSGVPQGGILSPTLFILYTADLPDTPGDTINIAYADDITQIIMNHTKSKKRLQIKTQREIQRINEYENKWKIQTNKNKFQLLSVSKIKPETVRVNNEIIPFKNEINILGLHMKRSGISAHMRYKLTQARVRKAKLKRFDNLNKNIRIHLYKGLIRPIFEYPNTPNCIMSTTNQKKLQSFQNGNKFITNT